ncbi:hypothetical protein [Chryseobacterium mucoviscidosis]|uniref:hypothetical protein n=1 Tax=Chryseobacterium mucoviscidosis TaxID=1945581 RepID=UPI0031DD447F
MKEFENLTLQEIQDKLKSLGFERFDLKVSVMIPENNISKLNTDNKIVQKYLKAREIPTSVFFMLEYPLQYISYNANK